MASPTFEDLELSGWSDRAEAYDDNFGRVTGGAIEPLLGMLADALAGLELLDVLRGKWRHVRETGGLCHFLTHTEPHLFGKTVIRDLYRALIQEALDAEDCWIATPSEVAEYWRSLE